MSAVIRLPKLSVSSWEALEEALKNGEIQKEALVEVAEDGSKCAIFFEYDGCCSVSEKVTPVSFRTRVTFPGLSFDIKVSSIKVSLPQDNILWRRAVIVCPIQQSIVVQFITERWTTVVKFITEQWITGDALCFLKVDRFILHPDGRLEKQPQGRREE